MLARFAIVLFILLNPWCVASLAVSQEPAGEIETLRTDSHAPYVHRITLYDHDGTAIDPEDEFAGPYSPRMTCAKCHNYAEISHGWHFNAGSADVPAGRRGQPWLLVDRQTGSVLPIAGHSWPGTFRPQDVGLTNWDFVKRFGHHTPGGGYGEPSDELVRESDRMLRWGISGKLEIDCMFCHSADQQHDPAEAARQIAMENFKWAPTAALGLAVIRGEARKAPDDWDPLMPPDPDFPEQAGPRITWDRTRFDPDNRVLFNITRRPPNERCYFCHSFRQVGSDAPERISQPQDVHLTAGLLCIDCHRNGIDHMMTRGYAAEAQERSKPALAALSCEGCHLGAKDANGEEIRLGGRYGAPHPQHRGLPPLHFEKLTCTACHCGPWPEMDAKRFQTARAHGLGLATRERADDALPHIVGPIFTRGVDGRITPQRMIWPAYWGRLVDNKAAPMRPATVLAAIKRVLPDRATDEQAQAGPLRDDELRRVLEALGEEAQATEMLFYARDGKALVRGLDGVILEWAYTGKSRQTVSPEGAAAAEQQTLSDIIGQVAAPGYWPIGHNVRPAAQSLGLNDCTDCHANDAPIVFGRIADVDDANADQRPMHSMLELRGDSKPLAHAWSFGFLFRPFFKLFAFICAAVVLLMLLRYGLDGLVGALRRLG